MLLLVGLGNPSPDNEHNRHNIGFKVIDAINKKFSLSKQKPKFKGLLTTGIIGDNKVYAIKPLTFMNSSGICIKDPNRFALLCKGHHTLVEKLKRFKLDKLERLFKIVKESK